MTAAQMPKTSLAHVFSPNYDYVKDKDAWRNNLRLTTLAAEKVRSSLGPNGAYKMVTYNRGPEKIVKVTRDAVAVLQELAIQYPTVTILSEAAKIQRQEVGDGVTCFAIFTSALMKKAGALMAKGIHPTIILRGYSQAAKKALEIIDANSKISSNLTEKLLETVDCGRNLLTSQMRGSIIEASALVTKGGKMDKDKVHFIRKPGAATSESRLIKGIVTKKGKLHSNMPDTVANPRIALTSGRIGLNRVEVKMPGEGPIHLKFNVSSPEKIAACQDAEKNLKNAALEKLGAFSVNVLFSQQPIDSFSKGKLLKMGVLAFESVDRNDLALISRATDTKVVSNLADLTELDIGAASALETEKIGLEKIITLTCQGYCTFLLRGSTLQALDELELQIRNALTLLQTASQSGRTLPGGGAVEMHMARQLKEYSQQFSGREQLAVDSFAEALMEIPRCLAANNGLNSIDAMAELTRLHAEGFSDCGIGVDGCCREVCVELAEVKKAMLKRAYEVAALMLRIDEQIMAKEVAKFHKQ